MKNAARSASLAGLLAAGVLLASGPAEARVSVGVDLNFAFPVAAPVYGGLSVGYGGYYGPRHGYGYYRPYPGWVRPWGVGVAVVAPPLYVYPPQPVIVAEAPPPVAVSVPATRPDPVIYPRNGQSAQQTEYDRQECNRWATTVPAAMADAGVFQRAVEACLDGRGYTMR